MSRSLIGVLLLALAMRIGAAIACEGHAFSADEAHWQRMAEAVWRHGLLSTEAGFFRPPLYPLLIACVYGVLGYEPLFVRLLQAVLSAATCLMPYGLARTAYGERAGLYAALLAACHPLFIFFFWPIHGRDAAAGLYGACALAGAARCRQAQCASCGWTRGYTGSRSAV